MGSLTRLRRLVRHVPVCSRRLPIVSSAPHLCLRLLSEGFQLSTVRKTSLILVVTLTLLSSIPLPLGTPVELLVNGNFKNGLEGWNMQGVALLDGESIKILREGSLSQIVQRPDLSFYLELSYSVRTELPTYTYFARSLVTFHVIDRQKKNTDFTIVGESHQELGSSDWKSVKLDLSKLFKKHVGGPENFQLTALKVTVELGFTTPLRPPAVAFFRNISLKRVNPVRILLHEGKWRELPDRTELVVFVTNVGDLDASNLVVTLMSGPETIVISGKSMFNRSALEGCSSWQLSWMLAAGSSGVHSVTIRASCDQATAELSLSVPVPGIPQITTTQTSTHTVTVEHSGDEIIYVFAQMTFLVLVALLIGAIVIPIILSRKGGEVVYRLRLLGSQ